MGYTIETNGMDWVVPTIYDFDNMLESITKRAGKAHGVSFTEFADTVIEFAHRTTKVAIEKIVYLEETDVALICDGIQITYEDLCDYVEILREYGDVCSPKELIEA